MPMNHRLMRPRTAQGGTLYYMGGDLSWGTLGNWWMDAAHTRPANRLPGVRDTVVILYGFIDTMPDGPIAIANLVLDSGTVSALEITVTGTATFNGASVFFATLNGNAVFNDTSYNAGTVNGDAVFNDTASNCATVNGTVTINGTPGDCP